MIFEFQKKVTERAESKDRNYFGYTTMVMFIIQHKSVN